MLGFYNIIRGVEVLKLSPIPLRLKPYRVQIRDNPRQIDE
jgi:hypothetical protein